MPLILQGWKEKYIIYEYSPRVSDQNAYLSGCEEMKKKQDGVFYIYSLALLE